MKDGEMEDYFVLDSAKPSAICVEHNGYEPRIKRNNRTKYAYFTYVNTDTS